MVNSKYLLKKLTIGLFCLFFVYFGFDDFAANAELSQENIDWIGQRIFQNECGGKDEYLLHWNDGEGFLSLGIGHFIWYPEGNNGPFNEGFPSLVDFLKEKGHNLPEWLDQQPIPPCPWKSRNEFIDNINGEKAQELLSFMVATKKDQAQYIVSRIENVLPQLLQKAPVEKHARIRKYFERMAESSVGVYVLIDYINFKGLGISEAERYEGQGWGLLQVLSEMSPKNDDFFLEAFVSAADNILTNRVKNAPPERGEGRWLAGWRNRITGYLMMK